MRVLLAVENDDTAEAIVNFAIEHKWPAQSTFRVVHVLTWKPPEKEMVSSQIVAEAYEKQYQAGWQLVGRLAEKLKQNVRDSHVEQHVIEGHPAERLISLSSAWKPDLLIIGSHGRKGAELFCLGSVSTAVVSHVDCSTMVLRPAKHASRKLEDLATAQ